MLIGDKIRVVGWPSHLSYQRSRQPNLLLHLSHRLGDDGQEAGGTVAEDVVDFMRQGEELVVAVAGGGVVGDQALGE